MLFLKRSLCHKQMNTQCDQKKQSGQLYITGKIAEKEAKQNVYKQLKMAIQKNVMFMSDRT